MAASKRLSISAKPLDYWQIRNQLGIAVPECDAPAQQGPQPNLTTSQPGRNAGLASASTQSQRDPATGQSFAQKTTVQIVASELDWNYAVIERVDPSTLKTTLIPFDLGKLVLQHDIGQDLSLEASDTVTIFSQGDIHIPIDQQTKYITLEGEVVHASTHRVEPNETLQDVLHRAGGLASKAYLSMVLPGRVRFSRSADAKRTYIIRAEGSVLSRDATP
jgi:hypothetical protein